jgi:hypothetical protein
MARLLNENCTAARGAAHIATARSVESAVSANTANASPWANRNIPAIEADIAERIL